MNDLGMKFCRVWVNEQGIACQSLHLLAGQKQSVFADGSALTLIALHHSGIAKVNTLILMLGEIGLLASVRYLLF